MSTKDRLNRYLGPGRCRIPATISLKLVQDLQRRPFQEDRESGLVLSIALHRLLFELVEDRLHKDHGLGFL